MSTIEQLTQILKDLQQDPKCNSRDILTSSLHFAKIKEVKTAIATLNKYNLGN